ncbi:MAG TPA: TetR/AcrR family transcriptional regulator [Chitinophagales bacterium]|nr:TetR/AcrR family transcriptional regulator [Chitinophagales bacterium]
MSKAEKTKQYIIEKTAPVFNKKGYAGTSLNDIIDQTGLTKGSIYGNFENKDEVALAAFEHNVNKVSALFKEEIQKQNTIKEKLLVYPLLYEKFLKHPFPEGGCPILNTAIEADDTHPLLRAKALSAFSNWKNAIIRLIEKGKEKKEIKKNVNAEETAIAIIALIEGGIMLTKLTGKTSYIKTTTQKVIDIINDL